jgi:hypothetical protein
MRKKKSLLSVSFLLFVFMGLTPVAAASTQWFPTEGATSDYAISHTLYLLNGTLIESNKFDLYYSTSYKVVPSILEQYFTPPDNSFYTSIANGTSLTFRHSYTENSLTEWKRTKTIMWDNGSASDIIGVNFFYYEDTTFSSQTHVSGDFDTVDKNNFWTSMPTGAFLDYWDSTLGMGSTIYNNDYPIIGITSETIITHERGTSTNRTYVAGRDGRVRTRIIIHGGLSFEARGVKTSSFTFTLVEAEGSRGIPSFPIALTVLGLIVGVIIIISSRRKLYHKF